MKIPIVHFNSVADGEPSSMLGAHDESVSSMRFDDLRAAQGRWAATPLKERLRKLRSVRHALVANSSSLVRAMNARSEFEAAEMLAAQILPLADACRFLERAAGSVLQSRKLGHRGRPFWLHGSTAEIHREPCGVVLVIAPSNYPLFLPGTVLLQALAAGNSVVLKPGRGGTAVARHFLSLLRESGIDRALISLLPEAEGAVHDSLNAGVDRVVFIGSANTGRKILRICAEHLVPATVELSGSDAMFVRSDADLYLAARALLFGLRLNRGATCIAPRRVFVHESRVTEFEHLCLSLSLEGDPWMVSPGIGDSMARLVWEAIDADARIVVGEISRQGRVTAPLILSGARPSMSLLREDHFGPVAAIVSVRDDNEALAFNQECPFGLGASIFSRNHTEAGALATRINAGSVVINDLIIPTADPRVPFGGRKFSGFGAMRGAEGLLELTVPKVVITRRGQWRPHFDAPRAGDREFFAQLLALAHASKWAVRFKAALALLHVILTRKKKYETGAHHSRKWLRFPSASSASATNHFTL